MDVMCFGSALHNILQKVLAANLCLGLVYISKVNLANAYMRLWVSMEDDPSVAFLVRRKTPINQQLVGF